jgi:hypothetical protein
LLWNWEFYRIGHGFSGGSPSISIVVVLLDKIATMEAKIEALTAELQ